MCVLCVLNIIRQFDLRIFVFISPFIELFIDLMEDYIFLQLKIKLNMNEFLFILSLGQLQKQIYTNLSTLKLGIRINLP